MAGKRGHPRAPYSTWKKTVWLSPECLDLIATWRARQPGTTVSSAVETLVRLGLQQDVPTAYAAPARPRSGRGTQGRARRSSSTSSTAPAGGHASLPSRTPSRLSIA